MVLPQPDSPASARISPGSSVRFTPSTARAATACLLADRARCHVRANAHVEVADLAAAARATGRLRGSGDLRSSRRSSARSVAGCRPAGRRRVVRRASHRLRVDLVRAVVERQRAHRGWNEQPLGIVLRVGRIAVQAGRRSSDTARRRSRGTRRPAPACTDARDRVKTSARRAFLHDPAGVHDREAVAHLGQHRQVVRDEQHREPERRAAARVSSCEDLRLHHDVERGRRLVGDRSAAGCTRAPSRSSRAASARRSNSCGKSFERRRRQADQLQQLAGACSASRRVGRAVRQDGLGDLVADPRSPGRARVWRPGRRSTASRPPDRAAAGWAPSPARPRRSACTRPGMRVPRGSSRIRPQADRRLAAAGLAGQAEHLAAARSSRSTPRTAGTRARLGLVVDRQVAHLEQAMSSLPQPRVRRSPRSRCRTS